MSKMSDMSMTIEELRSAAAAINEAANWLDVQFSSDADATPVAKAKNKKETGTYIKRGTYCLSRKNDQRIYSLHI